MSSQTVTELNAESFDAFIGQNEPVLVDFWAPWCGPCRALGPTLEQLGNEKPGRIAKVNIDDEPELATRFGIASIPTVIVFQNGQPSETLVGIRPAEVYTEALSE